MAYTPCPDFDLAPLTRNRRDLFLRPADPADEFVLAMALAFNDLKSAMWFLEQLNRGTPPDLSEPTPYLGQVQGMKVHVTRVLLALLHELLKAIDTAAASGTLSSPILTNALQLLSTPTRSAWEELVDAALQRESQDPLRRFLVQIRNNVASHYYAPAQLLRGYRRHFEEDGRSLFNDHVLTSAGESLEQTRFHFADAAAAGYQRILDPDSELLRRSDVAVRRANQGLRGLIEAYLRVKETMTT
jgi:hypothetical protein